MATKTGAEDLAAWLAAMPGSATIPFSTHPSELYSVRTLYQGYAPDQPASLKTAFDSRIYDWTRQPGTDDPRQLDTTEIIAARLHDTTIEGLIAGFLDAPHQKTVGFMGGHSVLRTAVAFRRVAGIARELRRRGFMIVTGGGPGLMEAANFGAFMAPFDDEAFTAAMDTLRSAPNYTDRDNWLGSAAAVRTRLLGRWDGVEAAESANLGVPTWVYGSEPPNLFATAIGKYFYNSLREDGLVTIANGGLVFGKGDAGTIQEVFQNATLNYYRKKNATPTPMVFYDIDFWNPTPATDAAAGAPLDSHRKPVFPLIQKLATEAPQPFDTALMLSNDPDDIVEFISIANPKIVPVPPRLADRMLSERSQQGGD